MNETEGSYTNSPLRMERLSKRPLGLNAEHENVATTMLRSQSRIGITLCLALEMSARSKSKTKSKILPQRYASPCISTAS